jgi:PKD repeat protein
MIEVFPLPVSQFSFDPNDEILYELDVQFNNASQGAVQYQWSFGDDSYSTLVNPIHEFATGGLYTVTLTAQNEFGCVHRSVQNVNIDNTFYTYIPNGFTPNNDGINDSFGPVFSSTEEIRSYRFYVKNKWGEIIFETDDPAMHWLGNDKNGTAYLHNDVFTWVIEIAFNNNNLSKIHEGTIMLVR